MLQSLTPRRRSVARSWRRKAPRLGRGAQVGLGHDLEQRRAAAVEVHRRACRRPRGGRPRRRGPAWPASSSRWARVMPTGNSPSGSSTLTLPPTQMRLVVLGDLVRLREVRIEVVLAVELGAGGDLAPQREARDDRQPHRLGVEHRQRARVRQADRAGVACWAGRRSSAAQPQNILVRVASWTWISRPITGSQRRRAHATPGGEGSKPSAPSRAWATVEQAVLAEGRPGDLQADRQPLGEAAGDRDGGHAGQADRDRADVGQVHLQRVVDPLARAGRRPTARSATSAKSTDSKARVEVAPDQRAHLLRAQVVGVVVARRRARRCRA